MNRRRFLFGVGAAGAALVLPELRIIEPSAPILSGEQIRAFIRETWQYDIGLDEYIARVEVRTATRQLCADFYATTTLPEQEKRRTVALEVLADRMRHEGIALDDLIPWPQQSGNTLLTPDRLASEFRRILENDHKFRVAMLRGKVVYQPARIKVR